MAKLNLVSTLQNVRTDAGEKRRSLTTKVHRNVVRPIIDTVQKTIWSDKRLGELKEFNPDVEFSPEEEWIDIGTVMSTSSTIFAFGGVLISPVLGWLSIPGLIIGSLPVYKSGFDGLKDDKKVNNDLLASVVQTVLLVNGRLVLGNITPLAYFSSKNFNLMARKRFENSLAGMLSAQEDQIVTVLSAENTELSKSLEEVTKNEIIVVYAGETIPVDGTIVEGVGAIDERVLTGESQPVEKGNGDLVYASTLVLSGKVHVRVDSAGNETIIAQIEEILNQTFYYTSKRELWAQDLTDRIALPTLGLSALAYPFLGISGAMAVIDSNPLYRLSIAGNTSLLNYLNITSQESILIKDGRALESLGNIDTFIFDKTGTLTEDELKIGRIYTFGKFSEDDALFYGAMAEHKQSHPIAKAILAAADKRQLAYPRLETVEYKLGLGLHVTWQEQTVLVGSPRFLTAENIPFPAEIEMIIQTSRSQGVTLVMVAVDGQLVGAIELDSVLRPESAELVAKLKAYDQIQSVMIVSGDHEAPTKRLAESIGITEYHAEVMPEGKADLIRKLQEEGRTVCFIGDGLNDSIALKQADVSISLRGASSLATSTAQVILLNGDLNHIEMLFGLAQHFDSNQKSAMGIVLGSSGACLVGVLAGAIGLGTAIFVTTSGFLVSMGVAFRPWIDYRRQISSETRTIIDAEPIIEPTLAPQL